MTGSKHPNDSKHRWQGKLRFPVVGEASLRPSSVADMDRQQLKALTEEQIRHYLTTADEDRSAINTELIDEPILAPGLIKLEEPKEEPTEKRVSLTDARLTDEVYRLFQEKNTWRVEELADALNHPKEPISRLMKRIGKLDEIRKWYTLKMN